VPRRKILLDACVAINLAATRSLDHIANTLQVTFAIAAPAAAEVGFLRDVTDGRTVQTPINLRQFEPGQVVEFLDLTPAELGLYIELAAVVDDGEAATIAIAIQRHMDLDTDDRRARRLCQERHLAEPLRTVSLLRAYADAAELGDDQIEQLVTSIRERASFQPPRSDPELKWWTDHAGQAEN
jgi:predicted nucleic acid-binding protein